MIVARCFWRSGLIQYIGQPFGATDVILSPMAQIFQLGHGGKLIV
jgi:hypothetical protein